MKIKIKRKTDFYSLLYYSTFAITLLNYMRMYSLLSIYKIIGPFLSIGSVGLTIALFFVGLMRYKKNGLLVVLIAILTLFVGYNSERIMALWTTFVLVMGAKDMSFRDIVKVHFIISLCFCLLNVSGSLLGMTEHANIYANNIRDSLLGGETRREHFGYGWSTDFANHVFFILLDLWILLKGRLRFWGCLCYIGVASIIITKSDARLASCCILMIVCCSLYLWKIDSSKKQFSFITRMAFILSIPVFAIVSILATLSYDNSNSLWLTLNLMLSNRLSHGFEAIEEYGISWLGQPVKFYGAINVEAGVQTNFVDSVYVNYLIRYGVVTICFYVYLFYLITVKALKRNDRILLFAIVIAGISGIIAQFLFETSFSVLILALFAKHNILDNKSKVRCVTHTQASS